MSKENVNPGVVAGAGEVSCNTDDGNHQFAKNPAESQELKPPSRQVKRAEERTAEKAAARQQSILDGALYAAEVLGLYIIRNNGKVPVDKDWPQKATKDPDEIRVLFNGWPGNSGAACEKSGIVVLDLDGPDGKKSLAALIHDLGPLPHTRATKTANGWHGFFRVADPSQFKTMVKWRPGIDIRGSKNGQVVLPPSVHESGFIYQWENDLPIADLPASWEAALPKTVEHQSPPPRAPSRGMNNIDSANGGTPYGLKALEARIAEVENAPIGQRNDIFYQASIRVGQLAAWNDLTNVAAAEASIKAAAARAGLDRDEIIKTFNSGFAWGQQNPGERKPIDKRVSGRPLKSDQGRPPEARRKDLRLIGGDNSQGTGTDGPAPEAAFVPETVSEDWIAQAIVGFCGEDIRYDSVRKIAFFWSGHRWEGDRTNRLLDLSRQYCRQYNPHGKASLGRHSTATGVMKLVAADQRVAVVPEIFDQNDLLLGCPGGAVDLTRGLFKPGRREDFITLCSGADPAKNEDCKAWKAFVDQCTKNDEAYSSFLKRLFGYLLTGKVSLHLFIIIFGRGGGGKTTFLDTIRAAMGTYAKTVDLALFMDGSESERRYSLAGVSSRRLITASETSPAQAINASFVKNITGEKELEARQIYGAPFNFQRKFTPILATNHRPKIPFVDSGLTRRLILLPFNNIPAEVDEDLGDKLLTELPGILRWGIFADKVPIRDPESSTTILTFTSLRCLISCRCRRRFFHSKNDFIRFRIVSYEVWLPPI
jgi:putative DNA primase/helicase